jgi:uncharacterized protein (TIGR02466 family)
MSTIRTLFATPIYQARLSDHGTPGSPEELEAACLSIAEDDEAGQTWCEENLYPGYTSYASLTDLAWRNPVFLAVKQSLDAHVAAFATELCFELGDKELVLEDLWINVLVPGGVHTGHLHPHSVISGTTYVTMPPDASSIKFEDPRLSRMMAAPPRRKDAHEKLRPFVYIQPEIGDVLLWESWLRHEVPLNWADENRISVSFNYKWE